jgi:hypothetical protein
LQRHLLEICLVQLQICFTFCDGKEHYQNGFLLLVAIFLLFFNIYNFADAFISVDVAFFFEPFLRVHFEHLKFGIARIRASRKKLIWSLGSLILSTLSKPALRNYVCKLSKFIFTGELLKTISIHCYHSINKTSLSSIF